MRHRVGMFVSVVLLSIIGAWPASAQETPAPYKRGAHVPWQTGRFQGRRAQGQHSAQRRHGDGCRRQRRRRRSGLAAGSR